MTTEQSNTPADQPDNLELMAFCLYGIPVLLLFPALHQFLPGIFWFGPGQNIFHVFLYLAELVAPAYLGFFLVILVCGTPHRNKVFQAFNFIVIVGLIFVSYKYGFCQTLRDQKRVEKRVEETLKPTLTGIEEISRRLEEGPLPKSPGAVTPGQPYVILMSKKMKQEPTLSFEELFPRGDWPRTLLTSKQYRSLYASQDKAHPEPVRYEVPYVYIVGYGAQQTNRRIRLDYGSVPEMRQYAKVYAVDPGTGRVIFESEKIMGGKARKPGPIAGTGIHYVSVLMGGRPHWQKIEKVIKKHNRGKI
ncbi:MAG: hypothetical protein KC900_01515 [Candidatus Omnitrophica bacterium]|nr:hypothetical protein [Candidatus Omnitrophota bacterium]